MAVLSIRFKSAETFERLKRRAARPDASMSSLGERLIEEGLRLEAHPGIVFRDGPAGRRAGLALGPDVWQVIAPIRESVGVDEERPKDAAADLELTEAQMLACVRYYAEYAEEIDAEIQDNAEAADRDLAAWENERRLLTR